MCDQSAERGNCEPECNEFERGIHHPRCSAYHFDNESLPVVTFADELRTIAASSRDDD